MLCPPTRSGSVTFCQTVSHGSSVACWNTTPTSSDGPSIREPASENEPVSRLISRIDAERGSSGLSSAVRVWLLAHYRAGVRHPGG